jgi:Domain of unknown function (DUF4166)
MDRVQIADRPEVRIEQELLDLRFRALLPRQDWDLLPVAVRKRFTKRLRGGATTIYVGRVTVFRISRIGRMLAQCLRLIGAPLPLFDHVDVPSIVSVTEDVATGGQIWSRMYANRSGFPQVIHSAKRFSGPTGLEEHLGFGITMLLVPRASRDRLTFESAGYQLKLGELRLTIPYFLTPGHLAVTHIAAGVTSFQFEMTLRHPYFGELLHQSAEYRDELT